MVFLDETMNEPLCDLPCFRHSGESLIIVELRHGTDTEVTSRVVELCRSLTHQGPPGVDEIATAYRAVHIRFDPTAVSARDIEDEIMAAWPPIVLKRTARRRWLVPVAYGGEHGMDLDWLAKHLDTTTKDVVERHSAVEYRVHMIGVTPGFTYLGGLDSLLHVDRRAEPRLTAPPGSVPIGGRHAAISPPVSASSTWHVLGRTPLLSYDPRRSKRPLLFEQGDAIQFYRVEAREFSALECAAAAGEIIAVEQQL